MALPAETSSVAGTGLAGSSAWLMPMFEKYGRQYGVDPLLLAAVAKQESGFNPAAVSYNGSDAGAGVMQLGKAMTIDPGYGLPPIKDEDRYKPEPSIELAARLLRKLTDELGVTEGLRAYSMGRTGQINWAAAGADPTKLFKENREYPDRVLRWFEDFKKGGTPTRTVADVAGGVKTSAKQRAKEALSQTTLLETLSQGQNVLAQSQKPTGVARLKDEAEWGVKAIGAGLLDTLGLLAMVVDGPADFTDPLVAKLDAQSARLRDSVPEWMQESLHQKVIWRDEQGNLKWDLPNLRQIANLALESLSPGGAIVGGGRLGLKGLALSRKLKKVMTVTDEAGKVTFKKGAKMAALGGSNSAYISADTYKTVYDDVLKQATDEGLPREAALEEASRSAALAATLAGSVSFVTGALGEGLAATGPSMMNRLAKGVIYGAATEAPEESMQYVAETIGTKKKFDIAQFLERGVLGAFGAGPVEGVLAAITGDANATKPPPAAVAGYNAQDQAVKEAAADTAAATPTAPPALTLTNEETPKLPEAPEPTAPDVGPAPQQLELDLLGRKPGPERPVIQVRGVQTKMQDDAEHVGTTRSGEPILDYGWSETPGTEHRTVFVPRDPNNPAAGTKLQMNYEIDEKNKTVKINNVPDTKAEDRGQGRGMDVYETTVRRWLDQGYTVTSDAQVSAEASRVYEGMARRGYVVTRNPNAQYDEALGAWADPALKDYDFETGKPPAPVYTVTAPPPGPANQMNLSLPPGTEPVGGMQQRVLGQSDLSTMDRQPAPARPKNRRGKFMRKSEPGTPVMEGAPKADWKAGDTLVDQDGNVVYNEAGHPRVLNEQEAKVLNEQARRTVTLATDRNPRQQRLIPLPKQQAAQTQASVAERAAADQRARKTGEQLNVPLPETSQPADAARAEFDRRQAGVTETGKPNFFAKKYNGMKLFRPERFRFKKPSDAKNQTFPPGSKLVKLGEDYYVAAPVEDVTAWEESQRPAPPPPDPVDNLSAEERGDLHSATVFLEALKEGKNLTSQQLEGLYRWSVGKWKQHGGNVESNNDALTSVLRELGKELANRLTPEVRQRLRQQALERVKAETQETGVPPSKPVETIPPNSPAQPSTPSTTETPVSPPPKPSTTPEPEPEPEPAEPPPNTSPEMNQAAQDPDNNPFNSPEIDQALNEWEQQNQGGNPNEPPTGGGNGGNNGTPSGQRRAKRDWESKLNEFEKLTLDMIRKSGLEWLALKHRLFTGERAKEFFARPEGQRVKNMPWKDLIKRVIKTEFELFRMRYQFTLFPAQQVDGMLKALKRLPPENAAELVATFEAMHSKVDEEWRLFTRDHIQPLLDRMKELGVTSEEMNSYLNAQHAKWRNAYIWKMLRKNASNPGQLATWRAKWGLDGKGPAGMTEAKAKEILDKFEADGKMPALRELDLRVRAMTQTQRDIYRRSGLVQDSILDKWEPTPGIDAFTEQKPADMTEDDWVDAKFRATYIPLRDITADKHMTTLIADMAKLPHQHIDVLGNEINQAKGRESPALYILPALEENIHLAMVRAQRAAALNNLWEIASENPNRLLWDTKEGELAHGPTVPKTDQDTGLDVYETEPAPSFDEDASELRRAMMEVTVAPDTRATWGMRNDQILTLQFKAPNGQIRSIRTYYGPLSKALSEMEGSKETNPVWRGLGAVNRFLSAVNTTLAPGFWLTNPIRDFGTAKMVLKEEGLENVAKGVTISNWRKAWKGYHAYMTNQDRATLPREVQPWYDAAEEFRKAGGHTAMFKLETGEELARQIKDQIDATRKSASPGNIRKLARDVYNFMDMQNNVMENAVRLAAFKAAKEAGMNTSQAAALGKNLTVNFGRRGYHGVAANALFLFYNASMQGNVRILGAMARSKKVRKASAAIIAASYVNGIFQSIMSGEDDDGRDRYSTLPEHVRERNIVVWIWGTDKYLKIPLPYGFNAVWSLGDNLADATVNDYTAEERLAVMLRPINHAMNAFNPIGSSSIMRTLAPTIIEPAVDIANNTNYFGSPINPQKSGFDITPVPDAYNVLDPDEQKVWQWIAQTMNSVSGGNPAKPGLADVSPGTLKYLVEYYTGSMGSTVLRTFDVVTNMLNREPGETLAKTPVLRRLYGQSLKFNHRERYYQLRETLDGIDKLRDYYKTQAKTDPDAYAEFMQHNSIYWDSRTMQSFESAERTIARLTRKRNKLRRMANKTETQRNMMENYEDQISKHMTRFNTLYFERIVKGDFQ